MSSNHFQAEIGWEALCYILLVVSWAGLASAPSAGGVRWGGGGYRGHDVVGGDNLTSEAGFPGVERVATKEDGIQDDATGPDVGPLAVVVVVSQDYLGCLQHLQRSALCPILLQDGMRDKLRTNESMQQALPGYS